MDIQYVNFGLLLLILAYFLFKNRLRFPLNIQAIAIIMTLLIIVILSLVILLIDKGINADIIRTTVTSITMLIALASFFTTFMFSRNNTDFTRETQSSNFVMTLIANNYKILEGKQEKIDALVSYLQKQFLKNGYYFNELTSEFIRYIKANGGILELIRLTSDKIDNTDYKRQFKKALEFDEGQVSRILMTFLAHSERYEDFYKKLDDTEKKKAFSGKTVELMKDEGLFEEITKFMFAYYKGTMDKKLDYDVISKVCNTAFDIHYQEIGHFFRNSYRIVKFINEQYKDDIQSKKKFLGILRSQYSENTILAIFYNSAFTDKGLGYGKELVKSDFFGTKDDLDGHQPIHFRQSNLIQPHPDINVMINVFCSDAIISDTDKIDLKPTLRKFYV